MSGDACNGQAAPLEEGSKNSGQTLSSNGVGFEELLAGPSGISTVNGSPQDMQDVVMMLCGMGLEEHEVLLFTKRNIGLDKLLRFTEEDLRHIGIHEPYKRREVLRGIRTLNSNHVEETLQRDASVQQHFTNQDYLTIFENTSLHLNTLCKTMPYIQRRLEEMGVNQFLNNAISARHTLLVVAEKGVQQADQVCRQLQALHREVEQFHRKKRSGEKSAQKRKLVAVLLTAAAFCCVALWKMRVTNT